MEVTFTRLDGRFVETIVTGDDGAVLATGSPGAGDRLPHDLIHYVVECELGSTTPLGTNCKRSDVQEDELELETIRRVCESLDRTVADWKRVPRGGQLRVTW
jgi:hypothetical protein